MLNNEEFEIYKKYKKILNPNAKNFTNIPTIGAAKQYYIRHPIILDTNLKKS